MPTEPSLEALREMLVQKPGIFPITQEQLNAKNLETGLLEESKRINTAFGIAPIKIASLRKNIADFQTKVLPCNKKASHLAFNYGLETSEGRHQIKLVMFGAKLDDSPTADLTIRLSPDQVSTTQFCDGDIVPTKKAGKILKHNNNRKHFLDIFMPLFDNRIVHGAYIRVDDFFIEGQKVSNFLDMLDKLEQDEHCDELEITFGFMKAITTNDWNCFHLIFRGKNSENNILSRSLFSTYEFTEGPEYTGPKPGSPPFSSNLSGKISKIPK